MKEAANLPPQRAPGGTTKAGMVWCSTQGRAAV